VLSLPSSSGLALTARPLTAPQAHHNSYLGVDTGACPDDPLDTLDDRVWQVANGLHGGAQGGVGSEEAIARVNTYSYG